MPTHPEAATPTRHPEETRHGARIKVVGVGGGGNNAIDRMIASGMEGVEFIALNTDIQALHASKAKLRGQIGSRITNGLGAGSDPDIGRRAALDDSDKILKALEGADMVFVTAGLGGGTGTGAAPVIAALASEMGALTVAIVTRPFGFEGKRRMAIADWGIQHLLNYVDTLIVIPNEKLLAIAKDAPFFDSFRIADDFLRQAVQGISDIITTPGVINRDFADVKTTMAGMGYAVMGTASRSGPTRATDAVMEAMESPLLEAGAIDGARGILINISGSSSLRLSEVNDASTIIQNAAHEDANIIFGAVLDERLGNEVKVTVIATGFRNDGRDRSARRARLTSGAGEERAADTPVIQAESILPQASEHHEPHDLQESTHVSTEEFQSVLEQQPIYQQESQTYEQELDHDEPIMTDALLTIDHLMAPDGSSSKESSSAFQEEEDWKDAIREISRLTESDMDFTSVADDAHSSLAYGNDAKPSISTYDATTFDWHSEDDSEVEDCATLGSTPTGEIEVSARLPQEAVSFSQTEAAAPMLGSRQAAIAAYTNIAAPEPESHRSIPATAFASILEARRKFVEILNKESSLTNSQTQSVALASHGGDHVDETALEPELQGDSMFTPAEFEEGVSIRISEAPPLTSPAAIDPAVQRSIHPLFHAIASGNAVPSERVTSEDLPKPLPEFNRRLHRDGGGNTSFDMSQDKLERPARIPSFATGGDDDGYTGELDELDIPAFLRRGN